MRHCKVYIAHQGKAWSANKAPVNKQKAMKLAMLHIMALTGRAWL